MKQFLFISILVFSFSVSGFGQTAKIKVSDLLILTGKQWSGTLSYLDYGTNKKISIPSNLTVTRSKNNKSSWIFDYRYPKEPKADSAETVTVSKDGKILDGEAVVERTILPDKTLKIVTEKNGTDNNKNAVFRYTYMLNKSNFSIKKEVRYEGAAEFFGRNEYIWKR